MFDAADGFFHLLFANYDDDYFTSGYVRMHFLSYLRWQMLRAGFHCVYLLFPAGRGMDADYQMQWVGSQSLSQLNNEQKKGFFSLFKGKNKNDSQTDCIVECEELSGDELYERLTRILHTMKNNTAVAMPAELLARLTQQHSELITLISSQMHRRGNVMILTMQPRASETDALFRLPASEIGGAGSVIPAGFLCRSDLFPEIADALSAQQTYRSERYAAVKEALGSRMLCWNSLTYEDVRNAVRYAYYRHPDWEDCDKCDAYAAILWAWHTDAGFRDRNYQLGCRENPLLKRFILLENLSDSSFRTRLAELVQRDLLTEPDLFVRQFSEESIPLCIQRAESEQDIVSVLTQYRALLRGHEELLDTEDLRCLIEMTEEFRAPELLSVKNASKPAYCKFRDAESRRAFNELFDKLRQKKEWNHWDRGIMYLLYVLFSLCREDAQALCGTDDYHLPYDKVFLKTTEAIRFCMRQSAETPYDHEAAARFTQKAAEVFRSKDYNKIRNYPVR